ncbi:hypothetical protein [Pseudoduganella dura]|nr:hypothetical protein [Pseudoduganella dura]GGX76153.1 hypothetical protein GCM10007386_03710 [Pseudoduganella dura]
MAAADVFSLLICIRLKIMDWFPIVAGTFKVLALSIGMFFAIKWHYDQGKKNKQMDKRAMLRAVGKVAAIFVLSLLALGLIAFALLRMLGNDMTISW